MDSPKISVVVPVYNAVRWLGACLDSIAAQTANGWECVLVDDGSTDSSGAICDARAARDERFRVIHKTNGGVSSARNAGVEAARGGFIAFVDADDTVEREYLSALVHALGDAGLAVCGIKKIGTRGVEVTAPAPGVVSLDGENAAGFVALARQNLLFGPVGKLYRAEVIRRERIRFPEGVSFGEDLTFNFAYLEHTRTIAVAAAALYNYLATPGSLSTAPASRDFDTNFDQWMIIRNFFVRRGIIKVDGDDLSRGREFLSNRLWGLAYDTAMSRRMTLGELRRIFNAPLTRELRAFDTPSIAIPRWLRRAILRRNALAIWLIQRVRR
jgi:glycosyltransferase involved in cell wall biosynthesis